MATQAIQKLAVIDSQASKETLPLLDLKVALADRTQIDDDTLGLCIEEYGGGALMTLKLCLPLVDEMKRRFKLLDKKKQVNGGYKTIRDCRTFQDYCKKVLHRTEQAVYLMLRGGTSSKKKEKELPEPLPTLSGLMRQAWIKQVNSFLSERKIKALITPCAEMFSVEMHQLSESQVTALLTNTYGITPQECPPDPPNNERPAKKAKVSKKMAIEPSAPQPATPDSKPTADKVTIHPLAQTLKDFEAGRKRVSDLTPEQKKQIHDKYALGTISQKTLAEMFGVSQPTISNILREKAKSSEVLVGK